MDIREFLSDWVAPRVHADGGWLEYGREEEGELVLKAKGECARCASLDRCLKWVGERLEEKTGEKMRIRAEREPFIWRR